MRVLYEQSFFLRDSKKNSIFEDNAYACDPRILKFKQEEKRRKEEEKSKRKEAIRQREEEEKRVQY